MAHYCPMCGVEHADADEVIEAEEVAPPQPSEEAEVIQAEARLVEAEGYADAARIQAEVPAVEAAAEAAESMAQSEATVAAVEALENVATEAIEALSDDDEPEAPAENEDQDVEDEQGEPDDDPVVEGEPEEETSEPTSVEVPPQLQEDSKSSAPAKKRVSAFRGRRGRR